MLCTVPTKATTPVRKGHGGITLRRDSTLPSYVVGSFWYLISNTACSSAGVYCVDSMVQGSETIEKMLYMCVILSSTLDNPFVDCLYTVEKLSTHQLIMIYSVAQFFLKFIFSVSDAHNSGEGSFFLYPYVHLIKT